VHKDYIQTAQSQIKCALSLTTEGTCFEFLEKGSELPECRCLLQDQEWLFGLAFIANLTIHLHELNVKLQETN
jgi:hypothetical protein